MLTLCRATPGSSRPTRPADKSATTTTSTPLAMSASARCEPIKPAPPVTRTRITTDPNPRRRPGPASSTCLSLRPPLRRAAATCPLAPVSQAIVGRVRNPARVSANPATPEPRPPGGQPCRAARGARRLARLIGAGLVGCLAAGCGAGGTPAGHGTSTAPASASATAAASAAAGPPSSRASAAGRGGVSKILVIMEENHSTDQVFPDGMPYLWQLAHRYGHATRWDAITHPSLPNYLAIFSGSTFNDPQDCSPGPGCTYPGP